jgi:hypothetical protein
VVQIQRRNGRSLAFGSRVHKDLGMAGGEAAVVDGTGRRLGWRIALVVAVLYFGLSLLGGVARIVGGDLWFIVPTAVNALLAFWVVGGILRRLRPIAP